ncbi:hypothetical protein COCSUDRAFT_31922 [Coccomyxa subellipsoidea C-169]|uniref:Uncharacterized protein n=1 Tax=Coccomyxa subellipsoidea (strain C-169) TaxID=574566 RepID=I0Z8X4_COCSC|nr:hypothetical protein COCSUDRAFT_31922 [Coccomyxa subellipsoidea C-169]EIE27093.1 hypothetical protein COCSUDRAFT_31922 [Coccomyxa subellipsoidea C-169]|eukprot:XP_005651637.1 hypothetical protein COCSUDRAFT_31922 [Coccomyxa subellipsoidea C-169]
MVPVLEVQLIIERQEGWETIHESYYLLDRMLLGDLLLSNNLELKTYAFRDGPEKPNSYYFVPAPGAWTVLLDPDEGIGPGYLWI